MNAHQSKKKRDSKFYDFPLNKQLRDLLAGADTENFASSLGVSVEAVRQWKSGYSRPDVDKIPMIAQYFKVSIDYLFNITEYPDNETRGMTVEEVGLTPRAVKRIMELGIRSKKIGGLDVCHTEYKHILNSIIESDKLEHMFGYLLFYYAYSKASQQDTDADEYTGADIMAAESVLASLGMEGISYEKLASVSLSDACDMFKSIAMGLVARPWPEKKRSKETDTNAKT